MYASWNGSTEHRSWEILAGPAADRLARVTTVPAQRLETTATAATAARFVAVEALDAAGAPLARSGVVRVSGR